MGKATGATIKPVVFDKTSIKDVAPGEGAGDPTRPDVKRESRLTVEAVLALPEMAGGDPQVLAGHSGLDRQVRWVHSGEVPNMAEMLKGDELLLTAGLGIGSSPEAQEAFIAELAATGVAAVALELGDTFDAVPLPLVQAARANDLCLISLRREVRFVEITEAVHRRIIDADGELVRRTEALHQRFTKLLLQGAKVADVVTKLGEFVDNPIVLDRASQGIAYHFGAGVRDDLVFDAWRGLRIGSASAPATVEVEVPSGGEPWGRLVILGLKSPPTSQDRIAAERAVGLVALGLMRDREERELARRRHRDFLMMLVRGSTIEADTARWAEELGFPTESEGTVFLPLAVTRAAGHWTAAAGDGWQLLLEDLLGELRSRHIPFLAAGDERDEHQLLLLGLRSADRRAPTADAVTAAVAAAAGRRLDGARVVVSVGATADDWTAAAEGMANVIEAAPMAASLRTSGWYDAGRPDTERLLWSLRDADDLHQSSAQLLEPLRVHDRGNRGDLVKTLTAFCEHGCRKADAARALQIERQTLYHRLARIEELLGADLSDGRTILGLHLALTTDSGQTAG